MTAFLLLIHGDYETAKEVIGLGEQPLASAPDAPSIADVATHDGARTELVAAFAQLRGLAALVVQDTERAAEYSRSSLAVGHWSTMLLTQPQCIAQLGLCAVIQRDRAHAASLIEQALAISEARGDTWHRCYLLWILAITRGEAGETGQALGLLQRALRHTWEIDERMGEATLSETLAWLLASCGDARSAAFLLGAVDREWQPSGVPRHFGLAHMAGHREIAVQRARQQLGENEYARLYEEGQTLRLRNALERICEVQK